MAQYALIDSDGLVFDIVEADQEFFDNLDLCPEPCTCCPASLKEMQQAVEIPPIEPAPGVGWSYTAVGWTPPAEPEPPATP